MESESKEFDPRVLNAANILLDSADLSQADFSGGWLMYASFQNVSLSGADLSEANLQGTNLVDADLSRADLSRADLSGAHFSGTDLSGTDLRKAILTNTHLEYVQSLTGTKMSGVVGLDDPQLRQACIAKGAIFL